MNYFLEKLADRVEAFMGECRLLPHSGRAFVALSGGRDSVLLLLCLERLLRRGLLRELGAFHFNYGAAGGDGFHRESEETAVRWCRRLKIPLRIGRQGLNPSAANFEAKARDLRYQFFRDNSDPSDRVYLGHHLDDSFEWSLLASMGSGSLRSRLGIPAVNGRFARPFLCVRRERLNFLAAHLNLEYVDDPSNTSERFARNYLRRQVIPLLSKRFPGYLRHYVRAANAQARLLGTSLLPGEAGLRRISTPDGGIVLVHPRGVSRFAGAREEIYGIIETLGKTGRGRPGAQVDKMIAAAGKGREGPFFFSGGVRGFAGPGVLFFIPSAGLLQWACYDRAILALLQRESFNSAPATISRGEITRRMDDLPFPAWGYGRLEDLQSIAKGRRRAHVLLPESGAFARSRGLWFGPLARLLRSGRESFQVWLPPKEAWCMLTGSDLSG